MAKERQDTQKTPIRHPRRRQKTPRRRPAAGKNAASSAKEEIFAVPARYSVVCGYSSTTDLERQSTYQIGRRHVRAPAHLRGNALSIITNPSKHLTHERQNQELKMALTKVIDGQNNGVYSGDANRQIP